MRSLSDRQWEAGRQRLRADDGRLCVGAHVEALVAGELAAHPIPEEGVRGRTDFAAAWGVEGFEQYYLAWYGLRYVTQAQALIYSMLRRVRPREIRVLDLGVGTGTTAIALTDLASRLAGTRVGAVYSSSIIRYHGIDASPDLIAFSRSLLAAYGAAIGADGEHGATKLATRFRRNTSWSSHRFGPRAPGVVALRERVAAFNPNVIVLMNVLAEMDRPAQDALLEFVCGKHVRPGTRMILTAPSAPGRGEYYYVDPAIRWRNRLVEGGTWQHVLRCHTRPTCTGHNCGECYRRVTRLSFTPTPSYISASPYSPVYPEMWMWGCELVRI